jgi:hypothetical protein
VDGLPERVGYMYNAFPDRATGENIVPLPEGLQLEEASNDISQTRKMSFYALLSDPFLTDRLVTHRARKGISVGYWDGSVQWIDMRARGILWNSEQADPEGGAAIKCFSEDKAGAIATRDTWVGLSGARQ